MELETLLQTPFYELLVIRNSDPSKTAEANGTGFLFPIQIYDNILLLKTHMLPWGHTEINLELTENSSFLASFPGVGK